MYIRTSNAGLCIEANPMYWRDLSFRKCQVVGAVVGENRMEQVKFAFQKGYDGGLLGADFDNKKSVDGGETKEFYTVPLQEILERNKSPTTIDYFSLDVEGAEYFIMKKFPFEKYTFRVMTIERPDEKLRSLLEKKGYVLLKLLSNFGETLWFHKSQLSILDQAALNNFDLPDQERELARLKNWGYHWLKNS